MGRQAGQVEVARKIAAGRTQAHARETAPMADSPRIFAAAEDNFDDVVIAASRARPVLVDFWAEWCAPCQMLAPVLARLVDEYQGKFALVKVNTDENQTLVAQFGVRSLPTLMLFKDAQAVEETLGAQPESVLREMLDRHIARDSDRAIARADELARQGDASAAIAMLEQALQADPANHRIAPALCNVLLAAGRAAEAEELRDALPAELRESAEGKASAARIALAKIAADAPAPAELQKAIAAHPDDLQNRHRLAARLALRNDMPDDTESALRHMLDIMRRDRHWNDEAGKRGLLTIFDLLADDDERVGRYRRKMFNLLH